MQDKYMNEAIKESYCNSKSNYKDGGPFGAIIVKDDVVIAKGKNSVIKDKDVTAHAEINAIRRACRKLKTHDLSGCVLYTTCYPCPMCMAAIIWANIKLIYYGNTKEEANDIGFRDDIIYGFFKGDSKLLNIKQFGHDDTIKQFEEFKKNKKKSIY